jgi:hypothetical protein
VREQLIDGLIQGDTLVWASMGALWLLTTVLVLAHRPRERAGGPWIWILLAAATATSLAGLPLTSAIAVPRVRWKTVDAPDLVLAGGETWRRLRGPAVVLPGPLPDIAVPTVSATDRWELFGVLSGAPVEGLPAALPAPNDPTAPRLCRTDADGCRPWPVAWPDPERPPPFAELLWSPSGPRSRPLAVEDALGYDVETGLYLRWIDPAPSPGAIAEDRAPSPASDPALPAPPATNLDGPFLELVGRVTTDAPRDGTSILFSVRRVSGGRLQAARIVATPLIAAGGGAPGSAGHAFHLQRADVSLTAGPRALRWFARPLLTATSFALPLGLLVILVGPAAYRRARPGKEAEGAAVRVARWLEAAAVLLAGVAAAAPAVVAMASLWGAR